MDTKQVKSMLTMIAVQAALTGSIGRNETLFLLTFSQAAAEVAEDFVGRGKDLDERITEKFNKLASENKSRKTGQTELDRYQDRMNPEYN